MIDLLISYCQAARIKPISEQIFELENFKTIAVHNIQDLSHRKMLKIRVLYVQFNILNGEQSVVFHSCSQTMHIISVAELLKRVQFNSGFISSEIE